MRKERFHKLIQVIAIVLTIAMLGLILYGWRIGVFSDRAVLEAVLRKAGVWAPLCFLILQIVQVVIPILPGGVSCTGGVLVFGAWEGFLYNYGGIAIGSVIAFALARRYGPRFVKFFIKDETYDKYIGWLDRGKKFDVFFVLALFFPGLPDDALCMICGLTKMTWKRFLTIFLLAKPLSIALYSIAYAYADELAQIYQYLF